MTMMQTETAGRDYSCFSDLYKDVYHHRPGEATWRRIHSMSDAEYDRYYQRLIDELGEEMNREARLELAAQKEFENRLNHMNLIYGIDRVTAMRWMCEAQDLRFDESQDFEHFLWDNGIAQQFWPMYVQEVRS